MALKARIPSAHCPEHKWGKQVRNMACFAQLDQNNTVTQVIVVKDDVIGDKVFPESEQIGIDFCRSLFGNDTNWKQTSPERAFRKNYAGIGYSYHATLDTFLPPKPYNSWILDPVESVWEPPVPMPSFDKSYRWDENSLNWIETETKAPIP